MAFSRFLRTSGSLVLVLCATIAAHACTVCDSPTAHRVRAGIFNGHFLHTLGLVVAPFPVFALAIGLLHFGMPDLDVPGLTGDHDTAAAPIRIRIGGPQAELSA